MHDTDTLLQEITQRHNTEENDRHITGTDDKKTLLERITQRHITREDDKYTLLKMTQRHITAGEDNKQTHH